MTEAPIQLEREGDVFIVSMTADENRWNTTFVRAFNAALDEIESSTDPVAMITASMDEKFFSNGLDLEWMAAQGEHPGGDRDVFGSEYMALCARLITFPVPTVAAVNGHAFGAGFMIALCHDLRIMREDRGYLCANEVEIGMTIPEPELALFDTRFRWVPFMKRLYLHVAGRARQPRTRASCTRPRAWRTCARSRCRQLKGNLVWRKIAKY